MSELHMAKVALIVFTLVAVLIMVLGFAIAGSVSSSKYVPPLPPKKKNRTFGFISPDKKPGGII